MAGIIGESGIQIPLQSPGFTSQRREEVTIHTTIPAAPQCIFGPQKLFNPRRTSEVMQKFAAVGLNTQADAVDSSLFGGLQKPFAQGFGVHFNAELIHRSQPAAEGIEEQRGRFHAQMRGRAAADKHRGDAAGGEKIQCAVGAFNQGAHETHEEVRASAASFAAASFSAAPAVASSAAAGPDSGPAALISPDGQAEVIAVEASAGAEGNMKVKTDFVDHPAFHRPRAAAVTLPPLTTPVPPQSLFRPSPRPSAPLTGLAVPASGNFSSSGVRRQSPQPASFPRLGEFA